MKLSFVIPAYNEEAALPGCLQAVQQEIERAVAAGEIARDEVEVVVVNNASTDKTKEVAQQFSFVRVVDECNKGLVRARKAGFEATSGELVANIDADTHVPPGWLSKLLRAFAHNPRLVALSGPYVYYDFNALQNFVVKLWYFPGWLFDILAQPLLGHATMLQGGNFVLRRDAWQKAGGFDSSIEFYGEDADVARRISKFGRVVWTWKFPMYTSARRLRQEGFFRTGLNYVIGLFSVHWLGRPYSQTYTDVRPK